FPTSRSCIERSSPRDRSRSSPAVPMPSPEIQLETVQSETTTLFEFSFPFSFDLEHRRTLNLKISVGSACARGVNATAVNVDHVLHRCTLRAAIAFLRRNLTRAGWMSALLLVFCCHGILLVLVSKCPVSNSSAAHSRYFLNSDGRFEWQCWCQ